MKNICTKRWVGNKKYLTIELNVEIDGFLTFADFFFDGLLADLLVQSKISDAKQAVDNAIFRVDSILARLRAEQ